jgi:DNA modification methylase
MTAPVLQVGDSRDLSILGLQEGSVDCIVTSPPYWHLKQYAEDDEREIGHQQSKDDYLKAIGEVFKQCFALAKPEGVMWLVIDTLRDPSRQGTGELVPLPFELGEVAQEEGWRLHDVVIWEKNKTLPYSGAGKLRNLIEYVLFLTKSTTFKHRPYRCAERHRPGAEWLAGWPERYHPLGKRPANVWEYDIETQGMWDHSAGIHACPFPQDLVARFLELTTDKGDVVLDPFAGIGTVPAQAAAMGRMGYGVELNPENVRAFNERVLSSFQADWEAGAELRRLEREDQLDEAGLILKLRLLKAGKELMRTIERLGTARAADHPAADVESVLVLEPANLLDVVDVEAGKVARPDARLLIIGDLTPAKKRQLLDELAPLLKAPPFTTFGLNVDVEATTWKMLPRRGIRYEEVLEFGQSRHGAFTAPLHDERLFSVRPRLLTTVTLPTSVNGHKRTALDDARDEAERRLLQQELNSDAEPSVIAARLGIPRAELHRLLLKYKLIDEPRSFAIALPSDQLALS